MEGHCRKYFEDLIKRYFQHNFILTLGLYGASPMMFPNPFLRKPKRIRTAFTPAQLMRLEQEFKKNQ